MRIAKVCPLYYPNTGGVETRVGMISERLPQEGLDLEVLTCDPSGRLPKEEIINGVKVRRFKSWAPNESYYFSSSLRRYLLRCRANYDLVDAHCYHALPALYAAQTKGKHKLVFAPHYHGAGHTFFRNLLHIPYKFFGNKIFEKADRVVCVSKYEESDNASLQSRREQSRDCLERR